MYCIRKRSPIYNMLKKLIPALTALRQNKCTTGETIQIRHSTTRTCLAFSTKDRYDLRSSEGLLCHLVRNGVMPIKILNTAN